LDLAKFIASLLIIAIHTTPLFFINESANFILVHIIARLAVPFFFISSGFFLKSKINDFQSTKKYVFKLLKIYIVWTVIYLPIVLFEQPQLRSMTPSAIIFFIKELIFAGSYYHLWYLTTSIFAVVLIYFSLKVVDAKKLFFAALLLFFAGLLGDSYFGIFELFFKSGTKLYALLDIYFVNFITTRNGLFFGFLFILIGILIKSRVHQNKKVCIIGLTVSLVFLFSEVLLLEHFTAPKDYNMYFSLVPASFFLFSLLIQIKLPDKKYFYTLRQMSLLIFLSHLLFKFLFDRLSLLSAVFENPLLCFFFVAFLSILFSLCIIKLETKKGFAWLKILH